MAKRGKSGVADTVDRAVNSVPNVISDIGDAILGQGRHASREDTYTIRSSNDGKTVTVTRSSNSRGGRRGRR